jgi:hypothetical protein
MAVIDVFQAPIFSLPREGKNFKGGQKEGGLRENPVRRLEQFCYGMKLVLPWKWLAVTAIAARCRSHKREDPLSMKMRRSCPLSWPTK